MPIRVFEIWQPRIAASAYIDNAALIIGNVEIGADSSVWPMCVVRGDVQQIRIGARTNLQDGAVVHVTHDSRFCPGGQPTHIGDDVTIGHKALLHACTIEGPTLIGMNAVIMDGAVVKPQVIVGAHSVVPPGKVLESGYLYVGSPVKQTRPLQEKEIEFIAYSAQNYVRLKNRHKAMSSG